MPKVEKPKRALRKNEPEWKNGQPPRGRGWPFTDYLTEAGPENPPVYANIKTDYTVAGWERCPKTGNYHWQGYLYCTDAHTWSAMKKLFPPTVHFEWPAKGPLANMRYCTKDGKFFQTGRLPRIGERTDITELYDLVKSGASDYEVLTSMPTQFIKYYRAIDRVRVTIDRFEHKAWSPVKVIVFWGPSQTGKSQRVRRLAPSVMKVGHEVNRPLWFDGYAGQSSILFEEFYGKTLSFAQFLEITDGYKYDVQTKGGHAWKRWNTVFFTSNVHPREWYPDKANTREFIRRFAQVIECPHLVEGAEEQISFPDSIAEKL